MKNNALNKINKILEYGLLIWAALYTITYIIIFLFRVQYPFELEWMEGGMVDHVLRIISDKKLYVEPSIEFVNSIYTPLYFYISALLSKLIGIGFVPLRLVSFLSSLGCFLMIFLTVKRETNNKILGFISAGLFVATFRISGAWFDTARVDSLFLFLMLVGIYLVRFRASLLSCVLAGIFVSLSFLTKQTALIITLPIVFFLIIVNWRYSILFIGTIAIIVIGSTIILDNIYNGWYSYFVFKMPSEHTIVKEVLINFWTRDLFLSLPIPCLFAVSYFLSFSKTKNTDYKVVRVPIMKEKYISENNLFYFLVSIGMFVGAWLPRLHWGGYSNVLMSAYAIIAIMFGLGIDKLLNRLKFNGKNNLILKISIYVLCAIQFSLLVYNPVKQIPRERDLKAGKKMISIIKNIEGEVFLSSHGYISTLAGKKSFAQYMAVLDIYRSKNKRIISKLYKEMIEAINNKEFGAIILDRQDYFGIDLDKTYKRHFPFFEDQDVFFPVTGYRTRPTFVFTPK